MKQPKKKIKNMPLVSVITPTYNRAAFLRETIKSVLSQDYKNIEYIILDGNSSDNTKDVVSEFENKLIFDSHKNRGEQYAVNKGFRMANGEIIGVVNSDDPLLPGAIKEIVRAMRKNPKAIGAYPDWIKIDEKGKKIEKVVTPEYSFEYMVKMHSMTPGPATFFRKKVIRKLKKRDDRFKYVGDFDFILRAALLGDFVRIPKFLSTFRTHKGAATLRHKGLDMALGHIRIINKLFSSPDLPPQIVKIKPQAYTKACEAARICRGGNPLTKIIVSILSLYYSPKDYVGLFTKYKVKKIKHFFNI